MNTNELIAGALVGSGFGLIMDLHAYGLFSSSPSKRDSDVNAPKFTPFNTLKWGSIGLIAKAAHSKGNLFAAGSLGTMVFIEMIPKIIRLQVHPKYINLIQLVTGAGMIYKLSRNG